jgi:predicted nucleic acid-binding protein
VIERVLIDTGPLEAVFSRNNQHHQLCSDALAVLHPPLYTCWPVLTEIAWLLRRRPDTRQNLFVSFASGLFALLAPSMPSTCRPPQPL